MASDTIHIIFANYDVLLRNISASLWSKTSSLMEHGAQYQSCYDSYWQRHMLYTIHTYCLEAGNAEKDGALKNEYGRLLAETGKKLFDSIEGKRLIWFMGPINSHAVPYFKSWLYSSGIARGLSVKTIVLAQRQDFVLKQWGKLAWKNYGFKEIGELFLKPGSFGYYAELHTALAASFGDENCCFLEYHSEFSQDKALADIRARLACALGLPETFFVSCESSPFPQSYMGLDVSYAAAKFPFTDIRGERFSRDDFYKMVEDVEMEEGMKLFTEMPLAESNFLMASFGKENSRLSTMLGQEFFTSQPGLESFADMPRPLPVCGSEELRPFVAAMPDKLRHEMLRYFRDLEQPLVPEQLALAKALENYRVRLTPFSGFNWPRPEPLLSVLTMTRNHKKYIMDCMESVSAQKTDFPIEHIIVDDCSDDGNQNIIDDYASTHPHVRPIYLPWRSGGGMNVRTLFNACKSEYAALCDGDDYFSEPDKLQTQVDFLKKNKDCGLCFHLVLALYENNDGQPFIFPTADLLPRGLRQKYYLADLFKGNIIQTNSVVYRWRFREGLPDWFRTDICPADWYWHLLHAETGKIGFIPRIMSIYRRHPASWYADSFDSPLKHRRKHGMAELETYKAMNDHFKNRYFSRLSDLAKGVFADFLTLRIRGEDEELLDRAVEKYPEFGLEFLKKVNAG